MALAVETGSRTEANFRVRPLVCAWLTVPTTGANRPRRASIPRLTVKTPLAGPQSALPDPAQRFVARWLREGGQGEVLAVAPRATRALGVLLPTAMQADHLPILPGMARWVPGLAGLSVGMGGCGVSGGDSKRDQAALARRIRRRRSEARSSSFRPPQVPYFSGREMA